MQARPIVRLMTPEDAGDVCSTASAAHYESHKKIGLLRRRTPEEVENRKARYKHSLWHDSEGARVAERGGRI